MSQPAVHEAQVAVDDEVQVAVDDEQDDSYSEIGTSIASSSTSLLSSLREYHQEHGRTYHRYKEGSTGIWAIDFGEKHPEADILGVDLSATQPGSVPSNVRFEVDDIEDENLEPGGYLEIQETDIHVRSADGTLKPEHALSRWGQLIMEAALKLGSAHFDPLKLKELMADAGFEDVSMSLYKFPTNTWPKEEKFKELGMWNHQNFMDGIEALTMAHFTRALEWTPEEVSVFLIDVRKNAKDRGIHGYWPQYIFVGRKPEEKKEDVPAPAPA
ncbi:putative methyltransferase tdiE [Colletotrichum spinosum]|uniref:Putative methyltransferase tdiE n=1 Tax=Colletotrichum spinosum TaxID=1347390 RepID=A0A4R8QGC6_9PEZI|nr:putative methyltransferase tdiE [Colletotrichum spinosum]